jgi:hypothetical protein
MTAQIRQIPPRAVSNLEKSICQTRVPLAWWVSEHPLPQPRPRSAVCPEPGRQQQSAPAEGPLNGGGGHLVAVGAHHRGDLAVPPRRANPLRTSRRLPRSRPLSAPAMAPSAGRRRGGGLVAASRFVRGSQRVLRTSRPTRHVPLSGPRGRRRDSVDEPVPPVAHRRRGHPMPTCCLGQRQLALQHGQHDLDLLVHRHLP